MISSGDVMAAVGVLGGLVSIAISVHKEVERTKADRARAEAELREREGMVTGLLDEIRWWRERYGPPAEGEESRP